MKHFGIRLLKQDIGCLRIIGIPRAVGTTPIGVPGNLFKLQLNSFVRELNRWSVEVIM